MMLYIPIHCRLATPNESPMNVQCIWRRKYSLGFRVGCVGRVVHAPGDGRNQRMALSIIH